MTRRPTVPETRLLSQLFRRGLRGFRVLRSAEAPLIRYERDPQPPAAEQALVRVLGRKGKRGFLYGKSLERPLVRYRRKETVVKGSETWRSPSGSSEAPATGALSTSPDPRKSSESPSREESHSHAAATTAQPSPSTDPALCPTPTATTSPAGSSSPPSELRALVLAARTLYQADEWPDSDQREAAVRAVIEATDRLPYDVDKALGVPDGA